METFLFPMVEVWVLKWSWPETLVAHVGVAYRSLPFRARANTGFCWCWYPGLKVRSLRTHNQEIMGSQLWKLNLTSLTRTQHRHLG